MGPWEVTHPSKWLPVPSMKLNGESWLTAEQLEKKAANTRIAVIIVKVVVVRFILTLSLDIRN
jgi:hypothetical protein